MSNIEDQYGYVRRNIARNVALVEGGKLITPELERGRKGAIIGTLNECCMSDEWRKRVLAWVFEADVEYLSTKQLTHAQWYALDQWIAFYHDDEDGWQPSAAFCLESFNIASWLAQEQRATIQSLVERSVE